MAQKRALEVSRRSTTIIAENMFRSIKILKHKSCEKDKQ